VLRAFATVAQGSLRASDVLSRWGGEEFLLLMPATDAAAAENVLERLRRAVRTMPPPVAGLQRGVSFSAGVAESRPGDPIETTIERADRAMYRAKREGRDRVCRADGAVPGSAGAAAVAPTGTEPVPGA
jgi:diguanylate cyclase (GGDEF)-like protein